MTQDWLDEPDFEVPDRGEWLGIVAILVVGMLAAVIRWVLL